MVDHEEMRNAYLRALNFKKPYIGKIGEKFFRPISHFHFFSVLRKVFKNNKLTIVLRSASTSKKLSTLKFTEEETATIMRAATQKNMTVEQFFNYLFQELDKDAKRKTGLPEM